MVCAIPDDVQDIYITEKDILYCPLGESHAYPVDDDWREDSDAIRRICIDHYRATKDTDFSFAYKTLRFRASYHHHDTAYLFVLRVLRAEKRTLDGIGFPPRIVQAIRSFYPLWSKNGGLALVAGTTGSGKSTTLAALFGDYINWKKGLGMTIEDPVENDLSVYEADGILIRQFNLSDYGENPWQAATQRVLRSNPACIAIGEIRDRESALYTTRISGMGKLTIATVHGLSVMQSIETMRRYNIEDTTVLANNIALVLHQRVEKSNGGFRLAELSFLFFGDDVDPNRAIIRSEKIIQLGSEIDAQKARLANGQSPVQRL